MAISEQKFLEKINAQLAQGKLANVIKTARTAGKQYTKNPQYQNLAGFAQAQAGRHKEAAVHFAAALKLAPATQEFENNLLQALALSGQHDQFDTLISRWLPTRKAPGDLLYLLAMSQMQRDAPEKAIEALDKAIALVPSHAHYFWLRSKALIALGRDADALADFRAIQTITPSDHKPMLEIAGILMRHSQTEQALVALTQAEALAPDAPDVQEAFARLALGMGDRDTAIAHYRRVITADPSNGMAFYQLAKLQSADQNAELEPALQHAKADRNTALDTRSLYDFAQAAISKQSGDIKGETRHLERANRAEATRHPYSTEAATRQFERLTGVALPPATDAETPIPVFVLGLPRSGTSLLEQILTVPDTVHSCGELGGGEAFVTLPDQQKILSADMARAYRSRLPNMAATTTHFVDKLPGNYRVIGLIHAAFPNARFLNMQRDPRDIALSMWRTYLAAPDLSYTFDQRAMAHEMNLYQRYMAHWHETLDHVILDVPYADLVKDISTLGRRAAAFCDIKWVDDMAHPERNTGIVRTASALQVREPAYDKSIGAWRQFEPALQAFLDALDPVLWPLDQNRAAP